MFDWQRVIEPQYFTILTGWWKELFVIAKFMQITGSSLEFMEDIFLCALWLCQNFYRKWPYRKFVSVPFVKMVDLSKIVHRNVAVYQRVIWYMVAWRWSTKSSAKAQQAWEKMEVGEVEGSPLERKLLWCMHAYLPTSVHFMTITFTLQYTTNTRQDTRIEDTTLHYITIHHHTYPYIPTHTHYIYIYVLDIHSIYIIYICVCVLDIEM